MVTPETGERVQRAPRCTTCMSGRNRMLNDLRVCQEWSSMGMPCLPHSDVYAGSKSSFVTLSVPATLQLVKVGAALN